MEVTLHNSRGNNKMEKVKMRQGKKEKRVAMLRSELTAYRSECVACVKCQCAEKLELIKLNFSHEINKREREKEYEK